MHDALLILKLRVSLLEAQQMSNQEFVRFFNEWHDYITRMTGAPLRERYAAEGMNAWLIRVDVEAREEKMSAIKRWAAEHIQSDYVPEFAGRSGPTWEKE
jgi:hypothetical protein